MPSPASAGGAASGRAGPVVPSLVASVVSGVRRDKKADRD